MRIVKMMLIIMILVIVGCATIQEKMAHKQEQNNSIRNIKFEAKQAERKHFKIVSVFDAMSKAYPNLTGGEVYQKIKFIDHQYITDIIRFDTRIHLAYGWKSDEYYEALADNFVQISLYHDGIKPMLD